MKEKVSTDDAPKADAILSQAIVSGGFIFVSGQVHIRPDGTLVEGTTEEKVQQITSNLEAILKSAGASLDNVVKVVIYVTDMSLMPELNKVYPTYFGDPLPAREAVCVKELPLGANIEISMVAQK